MVYTSSILQRNKNKEKNIYVYITYIIIYNYTVRSICYPFFLFFINKCLQIKTPDCQPTLPSIV